MNAGEAFFGTATEIYKPKVDQRIHGPLDDLVLADLRGA